MSTQLAVIGSLGWPELLGIFGVALLLFGAKKLPEIGRSLGKGIKEFKTGVKGLGDDVREGMESDDEPAKPGAPKDKAGS